MVYRRIKNNEQLTAPTKNWRLSAPQTVLWLIKHWFSASTFVVKIATFAKPQNVIANGRTTVQTTNYRPKHKQKDKTILTRDQKYTHQITMGQRLSRHYSQPKVFYLLLNVL